MTFVLQEESSAKIKFCQNQEQDAYENNWEEVCEEPWYEPPYVPRHACDACRGYVWFDDNHDEIKCNMTIEQYAAWSREDEARVLEDLKHIWDDDFVWDDDQNLRTPEHEDSKHEVEKQTAKKKEIAMCNTSVEKSRYDSRCLFDNDAELE
jgi:hypothetical protein